MSDEQLLPPGDQRLGEAVRRLQQRQVEHARVAGGVELALQAEPGEGALRQDEALHLARIQAGVGDHHADVVADEVDRSEVEVPDQGVDVGGDRSLVVAGRRAVRVAAAAKVGRDHGEVLGQRRDDLAPVQRRHGEAVQHHHRVARAGPDVVQADAVHLDAVVAARHPGC